MARLKSPTWPSIWSELKKRWPIFALIGLYLGAGLLFSLLIYRFHWNQPTTRWASQVFPLPAATVNGDVIWLSKYYRRLEIIEYFDARVAAQQPDLVTDDPAQRPHNTLEQLIDLTLVTQQAKRYGITVSDQEITDSYKQLTEKKGGEDAFKKVLQELYNLTPYQFSKEFIPEQLYQEKLQNQLFTQVHFEEIVINDEGRAKDILDQIKKGGNFEDLAKQFSQDLTTRDKGGDSGWISRGQLKNKQLDDVIFATPTNQLAPDLTKTEFGFHIIKVLERKDGPIGDKSYTDWFNEVRQQARIHRFVAQ